MKWAKTLLYLFLLVLPFAGGYFSDIESPIMDLSAKRLGLVICALLLGHFAVFQRMSLKISKLSLSLLFYYGYATINLTYNDELNLPGLANDVLKVCFLILLDNIDWNKKDLMKLANILTIVGIGTFLASSIQLFVDPYFYSGVNKQDAATMIQHYALGNNLFRNQSLYMGIGGNEAGIAVGMLFSYFLFMNLYSARLKYMILTGMMLFSGFIIFSKYVWLMMLIAIMFFVYAKFAKTKYIVYILTAIFLMASVSIFYEEIQLSTIYKNRIATKTYLGRTESTSIFVNNFFLQKPITGYGVSSWQYKPFLELYNFGIHVAHFDILFAGGLVGLFLFGNFLFQVYKKASAIFKVTGNPIFFVFLANYILINFTAILTSLDYYGYMVMLCYFSLYYKVHILNYSSVKERNLKGGLSHSDTPLIPSNK